MKYEAIEANSSTYEVKRMCKILELKAPNYYRWKKQKEKKLERLKEELEFIGKVEKAFLESDKTYGYRMIRKELLKKEAYVSEYRVRRVMRENGFYPETIKKYRPIHKGKTEGKIFENIVRQNFETKGKNEVWVGDITYIKTYIGWVYLAVVIDLFNREVVGYATSKKIDTELVKQALSNAIARQGTKNNMIFHSDQGCQYSSAGYRKMLENNGIRGSMSRAGCPYDNSCAESFFATIKKERIHRRKYGTLDEVKADMFKYIELFYNRKRMHSTLGYMSPVEYRLKYDKEQVA